jgi:hypothetical protein
MKSVMICLLTIALCLPCLAQDKFARGKDCFTQNIRETLSPSIWPETCAGDTELFITLTYNLTIRQCRGEDGGVTTRMHYKYHGTGVDAVTGNEYVLNAQQKEITVSSVGCEFTSTVAFREVLISKGPLPNQVTLIKSTITVDSICQANITTTFERICSK